MRAQFLAPTCHAAGLRLRLLLRNTARTGQLAPDSTRHDGVPVEVSVYEAGELVFQNAAFGCVPFDGLLEVSEANCPALAPDATERLVVARLTYPDDAPPVAQQHCLVYEHIRSGVSGALLYDQLPLPDPRRAPSPIILLAPKVWVGKQMTTYVVFAAAKALDGEGVVPLSISVLDDAGNVLTTEERSGSGNRVELFDVRAALASIVPIAEKPQHYNLVARGGSSQYAIMTFISNEATGTFALEHSLPPIYYLDGDMRRVRTEALRLAH